MGDLRPFHLSLCQQWPLAAMELKKKKQPGQPLEEKKNPQLSHQCKGTFYKILCDSHVNPRS